MLCYNELGECAIFFREIVTKGKVLYERRSYRLDTLGLT